MSQVVQGRAAQPPLPAGGPAGPADSRPERPFRHFSPVLRVVLAALGFGLPLAGLFWLIHDYGVNAIWYDQWSNVALITHAGCSPSLGCAGLWSQHNENRMLIPNLLVLVLAHTTHFNVLVEEYVSGVLLVIGTAFLIWTHHRRARVVLWLYFPIAMLMFSFTGAPNLLFGFQVAWYLVIAALALALFFLDRPQLTWPGLAMATAAAVVGSFSSLQGLFIWGAGLVLLYHRRRSRALIVTWVACAVATLLVYFYHFDFTATGSTSSYASTHPLATVKFFFYSVGMVVGYGTGSRHDHIVLVVGVALVAVAVWVLIAYGVRRDETTGAAVGVSLICFGLLFSAVIAWGRAHFGTSLAGRYTTFELLIPVGCYLALIGRAPARPTALLGAGPARRWVRAVLIVAVLVQFLKVNPDELPVADSLRSLMTNAAVVTANIDKAPDHLVLSALYPSSYDAAAIRDLAHRARSDHLSLFATGAVEHYRRQGIQGLPGLAADHTPPTTSMTLPRDHASLTGHVWLGARASDNYGVTKVDFRVTGGVHQNVLVSTGEFAPHLGWIGAWNTLTFPDGPYTLQSVAYDAAGNSRRSPPITVYVRN